MFQPTGEEANALRSQTVILKKGVGNIATIGQERSLCFNDQAPLRPFEEQAQILKALFMPEEHDGLAWSKIDMAGPAAGTEARKLNALVNRLLRSHRHERASAGAFDPHSIRLTESDV